MREKAGRPPPRYCPVLEIVETEFLLAVGQNVKRCPLPQLGGKFGILGGRSGGEPDMGGLCLCALRAALGRDLVLASDGLDFLRDLRKGKPDHPLADRNFGRSEAA